MKMPLLLAGGLMAMSAFGQQPGGIDLSKFDPAVVAEGVKLLQKMSPEERTAALRSVQEALGQAFGKGADLSGLSVDTKALKEGVPVDDVSAADLEELLAVADAGKRNC